MTGRVGGKCGCNCRGVESKCEGKAVDKGMGGLEGITLRRLLNEEELKARIDSGCRCSRCFLKLVVFLARFLPLGIALLQI